MFPKIGGKPPKWMVKIMENPIKMDELGVPLFLETPIFFPPGHPTACPKSPIYIPKHSRLNVYGIIEHHI